MPGVLIAKCSTPFGIRGRFTVARIAIADAYQGAQRLSASEVGSHTSPSRTSIGSRVCSTPFGIRGRFTHTATASRRYLPVCSTPFGIRGRFTSRSDRSLRRTVRAQRLSASEVGSQLLLCALDAHARMCSTPFGIRGRFTVSGVEQLAARQAVLNAFRHQR